MKARKIKENQHLNESKFPQRFRNETDENTNIQRKYLVTLNLSVNMKT